MTEPKFKIGPARRLTTLQAGTPVTIPDPTSPTLPRSLDSLSDVDGATAAATGTVLRKETDGIFRPSPLDASGQQHFVYTQPSPASVWIITHNLGFKPPAVSVFSEDLGTQYTEISIQHLDDNSLRVSMDTPTAGVALLA